MTGGEVCMTQHFPKLDCGSELPAGEALNQVASTLPRNSAVENLSQDWEMFYLYIYFLNVLCD